MWKILVMAVLALGAMAADDCPVDRETKCADDFQVALPYCKKAAESHIKDFDADLNCIKYFYQSEQECWPCICYIAHKENLKIKGCETIHLQ